MLTATGCQERRQALIQQVESDHIIIANPRHIQYLTGLWANPLMLSAWGSNFLIINTSTGHSTLIVHNGIAGQVPDSYVDEIIEWRWYDAVAEVGIPIHRQALRELQHYLQSIQPQKVAIESGFLPYGLNLPEAIDITDTLLDMRRVKYPDELELIKTSITAIEAGHQAARQIIQVGISELDVYNAINTAIVNTAGHGVLPLGDYVSGHRSGGSGATRHLLQAGELMLLDLFHVINGYKGDFTATISVDGTLSPVQEKLEKALHAAIAAGESLLKAGSVAGDVYRAVHAALAEYGFESHFPHHAGHGLGLGHPEAVFFVPNSQEILRVGEVVTLEPGAYDGANFGARIEYNYLITATGFERLTHHDTAFVTK